MNKKGDFDERMLLWIFYFVILIISFVYLWSIVDDQATMEKYQTELNVRDLALIVDSLHPTYASYSLNYNFTEERNLNFKDNIAKVDNRVYIYFNPDFELQLLTNELELKNG